MAAAVAREVGVAEVEKEAEEMVRTRLMTQSAAMASRLTHSPSGVVPSLELYPYNPQRQRTKSWIALGEK